MTTSSPFLFLVPFSPPPQVQKVLQLQDLLVAILTSFFFLPVRHPTPVRNKLTTNRIIPNTNLNNKWAHSTLERAIFLFYFLKIQLYNINQMRSSNVLPFPFHKTLRCALFLLKMFQVDILETYTNQRKNKIKLTQIV